MIWSFATHQVVLYDLAEEELATVYGNEDQSLLRVRLEQGIASTDKEIFLQTQIYTPTNSLNQGFARVTDLVLNETKDYNIVDVIANSPEQAMRLVLRERGVTLD